MLSCVNKTTTKTTNLTLQCNHAHDAALKPGKNFTTLKRQENQIAVTNVNGQQQIKEKLERIKLLEAKKKIEADLPHLYGQKFYPWSREWFDNESKMALMTKGNQVGGSSVMIRQMIHWATDPVKRKRLFNKGPTDQLLFIYFMPALNLFCREFAMKWIPQFMPRGDARKSGRYSWRAEYDEKKMDSINFIEFPEANTMVICLSYGSDPHKSMQASSPDAVFADEEMPQHILGEVLARLSATKGYFRFSATPTRGEKIWDDAFNGDKFPNAYKLRVSQYDCVKFEDGTPGVHSVEDIKSFEQSLPSKRDIDVRVHGKFAKVDGLVYSAFDRRENSQPLKITEPSYYAGIDYGAGGETGHPSAIAIIAVDSSLRRARLHKFWKGDSLSRTTAGDLVDKYLEISKDIPITRAFYDFAAGDFGTIAGRKGIPVEKANKEKVKGVGVINTLFKNQLLEIPDIDENFSLIRELETYRTNANARHANNHGCDALRYGLIEIPFDLTDLDPRLSKSADVVPTPTKFKTREEMAGFTATVFDDLDEQIDHYNSAYLGE